MTPELLFGGLLAAVLLVVAYAAGICSGLGAARSEKHEAYHRGFAEGRRSEREELSAAD